MLNNLEGSLTWHLKTNLVLVGCYRFICLVHLQMGSRLPLCFFFFFFFFSCHFDDININGAWCKIIHSCIKTVFTPSKRFIYQVGLPVGSPYLAAGGHWSQIIRQTKRKRIAWTVFAFAMEICWERCKNMMMCSFQSKHVLCSFEQSGWLNDWLVDWLIEILIYFSSYTFFFSQKQTKQVSSSYENREF